jgi:hypothetical protein
MIVGAVWYGVLANPWLEGIGKTREWANENQRSTDYIIAFAHSLLMAFFLANVLIKGIRLNQNLARDWAYQRVYLNSRAGKLLLGNHV